MNLPMKQKQTKDTENRLVVAKGNGGSREMGWEFGLNK